LAYGHVADRVLASFVRRHADALMALKGVETTVY
jgi:hypothetical protein